MYQCPVPDCPASIVEELTNYHCTTHHGMTKAEVKNKYGPPKYVTMMMTGDHYRKVVEASPVLTKNAFKGIKMKNKEWLE